MTDPITERLAEIEDDFKHLRYDVGCRRLLAAVRGVTAVVDSRRHSYPLMDGSTIEADSLVPGNKIRQAIAAALSDTRGGGADG